MRYTVGNNLPGCLPDEDGDDVVLFDNLRDAVLALVGDLNSMYEPDDSFEADDAISHFEELLPAFRENGSVDEAKLDGLLYGAAIKDLVDNRSDQVWVQVEGRNFWIWAG